MKEMSNDQSQDVTILFVEDDSNEILLLSRALSKSDLPAEAHFVQSPAELHEYLTGRGKFSDRTQYPLPKVILTDYRLCGASARDVIEWVRRSEGCRDIPVVVLSSFMPPREIEAILGAGARACLEKPMDFSHFSEVLQSAMKLARN